MTRIRLGLDAGINTHDTHAHDSTTALAVSWGLPAPTAVAPQWPLRCAPEFHQKSNRSPPRAPRSNPGPPMGPPILGQFWLKGWGAGLSRMGPGAIGAQGLGVVKGRVLVAPARMHTCMYVCTCAPSPVFVRFRSLPFASVRLRSFIPNRVWPPRSCSGAILVQSSLKSTIFSSGSANPRCSLKSTIFASGSFNPR